MVDHSKPEPTPQPEPSESPKSPEHQDAHTPQNNAAPKTAASDDASTNSSIRNPWPNTSKTDSQHDDSNSHENRPTSVPRSDRQSIATQEKPMADHVVLGKVLVSDGIEIKTVRPKFHIATLYTASPRNPTARIVFDKTGQVIRATLTRSSGYPDIDSPILNSLYEWRATGKKLKKLQSGTLVLDDLRLLIVDEPDQP